METTPKKKIKPMVRLTKDQIRQKQAQIQQYIESANASTGSLVDSNANVTTKTVSTLGAELQKDFSIQINRQTVADYIEKYFDKDLADDYIDMLESHVLYKHDESSLAPGMPYTYGSDEVVFVKYKNESYLVSFEQLFEICEEPTIDMDIETGIWCKCPKDMVIYDKDGFVPVTILTKKSRHRGLVYVKTQNGESLIVTDNHPLIISNDRNDTIDAILSLGKKQLSCHIDYKGNNEELLSCACSPYITSAEFTNHYVTQTAYAQRKFMFPKNMKLDRMFGKFVGYFIADGHYTKGKDRETGFHLWITQKDKTPLVEFGDWLYTEYGIASSIKESEYVHKLDVNSADLVYIFEHVFKIGKYAINKSIPVNIADYSKDFIYGMIEGLLQTDGGIHSKTNCASVRVCSRKLINQLSMLLNILDIPSNAFCTKKHDSESKGFKSNYDMFGINFSPEKINGLKYNLKASLNKWKKIITVDTEINEKYLEEKQKYIYDITTESRSFVCNNLWVHNCVAINMYPFLEDGMTKLGGESKAPKHLESFCGSFVNLIFAISSQFAGAVAAVEFLLYFHYFAQKDYGKDYLLTHADLIKQKFQGVIYCLNQPAAARGYQSVFFNMSVFDRYFFDSMFGHFAFPDGTTVDYDEFNELQKFFMEWLLEERSKSLLTFPVLTEASLNENGNPKDMAWAEFCADIRSRGLSFFSFNDDTPSALASCCLTGDAVVSYYKNDERHTTTIKELVEQYLTGFGEAKIKNEIEVDSFNIKTQELERKAITGVMKKRITEPMYTFSINGKTLIVTADHLFTAKKVNDGELVTITAKKLYDHCSDYLIPCIE